MGMGGSDGLTLSAGFLNAHQRGGAGPSGKPSFTVDEAAEQITRDGFTWSGTPGTAATVSYAYRATAGNMPGFVGGFSQCTAQQIAQTELALQSWSDVAGIVFVRKGAGESGAEAYSDDAAMLFGNYATGASGAAAFAYYPWDRSSASVSGDSWYNATLSYNAAPALGNYGRLVLVHEIGHAIGLGHPGDYNAGDGEPISYANSAVYYEDSRQYSVMSYWSEKNTGADNGGKYAAAPLLDDIAAAQRLYGPNMATRAGDTTYGFNADAGRDFLTATSGSSILIFAVWDAGGTDTFDFSGYAQDGVIELGQGAFSSVGGLIGNVAVGWGVIIENAIGGSGVDRIVGNPTDNVLQGGAGDDHLEGASGNDRLDGGVGNDTLNGGDGDDWVVLSNLGEAEMVALGGGADVIAFAAAAAGSGPGLAVVTDFRPGDSGDRLDLAAFLSATLINPTVGSNPFFTGHLRLVQAGQDTLLQMDPDGGGDRFSTLITLRNVAFGDLTGFNLGGLDPGQVVFGTLDPESLSGTDAREFIDGREGDDRIAGRGGADGLFGREGDDQLFGDAGDDALFGEDGDDLVVGGLGADYADAGTGADAVFGEGGEDNLHGGLDDDGLDGGDGDDKLYGEHGDDRLYGRAGGDEVYGGEGLDALFGGDGHDLLVGGAGGDFLQGELGDDRLYGEAGADIVHGGDGNDNVDAGEGDDRLYGEEGRDALYGRLGNDELYGGGGNDFVFGEEGNDLLVGGGGDDYVLGEAGLDVLAGEAGFDIMHAGAGDDLLLGGDGNDKLYGEGDNDRLYGAADNDELYGGDGADLLFGESGQDVLLGDGGDDVLQGGAGGDALAGGDGADRFVYFSLADSESMGVDRIFDFGASAGDLIDLSAIDPDGSAPGNQAFVFGSSFDGQKGRAVLSYDGASNMSTLQLDADGDGLAEFTLLIDGRLTTTEGWVL